MTQDLQTRLIRDLVTESNEALDEFDRELLLLEKQESDEETLNRMFRVIHSLKGTSGCLGLSRIESLAHAGENLLSLLRERILAPTQPMLDTLLAYADALRGMLRYLDAAGVEGSDDHSALLRDLQALATATTAPRIEERAAFGLFEDDYASLPEAPDVDPRLAATPKEVKTLAPPRTTETAIRVDLEQLDNMMDLVGELVLARNQIMQFTGRVNDSGLLHATERLNGITTELQETVMKTRMQPIGNVWAKFPRIARDVARDLGKQVRLVMEGKDTDLDRNIIEAIKDPLTHLVRNSIDHGLERPDQRVAHGKPAEGLLRLRAYHEGGQVNIEVYDDGAGIDREKVLRKAVQKNIVKAAEASQLSDREICGLIFAPGFSTAEQVTNISGRGVGMDVVKNNIERIGGSVDIESEPGRSTTIRIKIPLTLAIIPALTIRCAGRRYAIPQVSLIELVRVEREAVVDAIEFVGGAPVYRLRGNLLPLVYLREQLEVAAAADETDALFLLVLQAEGRQFGLVVDAIHDTEEIVVKPLGKELKSLTMYAGATIMGDGCVALILDVLGIARRANVVEESNRLDSLRLTEPGHTSSDAARQSLLLFSLTPGCQSAIPLSSVARLEELDCALVEKSIHSEVIQYRGAIMPLIRVNQLLGLPDAETHPEERLRVVVYSHEGMSVGLVVHRILDTVDEAVAIQPRSAGRGILGTGIVKKRVTDFLDIPALLSEAGVFVEVTQ